VFYFKAEDKEAQNQSGAKTTQQADFKSSTITGHFEDNSAGNKTHTDN